MIALTVTRLWNREAGTGLSTVHWSVLSGSESRVRRTAACSRSVAPPDDERGVPARTDNHS